MFHTCVVDRPRHRVYVFTRPSTFRLYITRANVSAPVSDSYRVFFFTRRTFKYICLNFDFIYFYVFAIIPTTIIIILSMVANNSLYVDNAYCADMPTTTATWFFFIILLLELL